MTRLFGLLITASDELYEARSACRNVRISLMQRSA